MELTNTPYKKYALLIPKWVTLYVPDVAFVCSRRAPTSTSANGTRSNSCSVYITVISIQLGKTSQMTRVLEEGVGELISMWAPLVHCLL